MPDAPARLTDRLGAAALVPAASLPAAFVLAGLTLRRPAGGQHRHGPPHLAVQAGQLTRLGAAPLPPLLRLAGLRPRLAGSVERCTPEEFACALEGSLGGLAMAAPFPPDLLRPAPIVWACRERQLPSIVLDIGAGTPEAWLDAGADLVLFDARSLGGPSLGVLCGDAGLVGTARDLLAAEGAALAAPPELVPHLLGPAR